MVKAVVRAFFAAILLAAVLGGCGDGDRPDTRQYVLAQRDTQEKDLENRLTRLAERISDMETRAEGSREESDLEEIRQRHRELILELQDVRNADDDDWSRQAESLNQRIEETDEELSELNREVGESG